VRTFLRKIRATSSELSSWIELEEFTITFTESPWAGPFTSAAKSESTRTTRERITIYLP
jgi:hypothetical protein